MDETRQVSSCLAMVVAAAMLFSAPALTDIT
jgi:hypothetical protein